VRELELHAATGHTGDGTAFLIPWLGVLVCGDYLSPVEIPMISSGGSLTAYGETLARLRPLVERCPTVVPGHGAPLSREDAQRLLDEDVAYLEALRTEGSEAPLPEGRRTLTQRRIHAENVSRL
jgi:glyoxylase-like metal-dependent hydrolase (beta-lactamase superfamily II)